MTTPPTLEWSDEFLLGYPPMDATHREFVEVVSALVAADDTQVGASLDAVARHAETHFADEKKWMESTDFPAAQCHIDEHAAVLKSVHEVRALVAQGNVAVARSLAQALVDWFPGHADYLDSALAAWMSKQRFGGKPLVFKRNLRHTTDAK